jgi:hypothetical protein
MQKMDIDEIRNTIQIVRKRIRLTANLKNEYQKKYKKCLYHIQEQTKTEDNKSSSVADKMMNYNIKIVDAEHRLTDLNAHLRTLETQMVKAKTGVA